MAKMIKYNTVEAYFASQSDETRKAMTEVRKCILSVIPETEEIMNYSIPAYTLVKGGKRDEQIMIAGYAKHVGFYPHPTTIEEFKDELKNYTSGKGSVQFPIDQPMPSDLIKRMVKFRWEMLNGK